MPRYLWLHELRQLPLDELRRRLEEASQAERTYRVTSPVRDRYRRALRMAIEEKETDYA